MSDSLEDLAEGIVYAESVLHSHRPVNPGPGRTRCPVCDAWYPCDLVSLAARVALDRAENTRLTARAEAAEQQAARLRAAYQRLEQAAIAAIGRIGNNSEVYFGLVEALHGIEESRAASRASRRPTVSLRVTVEDIETGDTDQVTVKDGDYILIVAEPCRVDGIQVYKQGQTHVITVKDRKP